VSRLIVSPFTNASPDGYLIPSAFQHKLQARLYHIIIDGGRRPWLNYLLLGDEEYRFNPAGRHTCSLMERENTRISTPFKTLDHRLRTCVTVISSGDLFQNIHHHLRQHSVISATEAAECSAVLILIVINSCRPPLSECADCGSICFTTQFRDISEIVTQ